MKKRAYLVILCIVAGVISLGLAGCSGGGALYSVPTDTQSSVVLEEAVDTSANEQVSSFDASYDDEIESSPSFGDNTPENNSTSHEDISAQDEENELFRVGAMREDQFYLQRGSDFYTLNQFVCGEEIPPGKTYNVGKDSGVRQQSNIAVEFQYDDGCELVTSYEGISPVVVQRDDVIICQSSMTVPELQLFPMDFGGYTIDFCKIKPWYLNYQVVDPSSRAAIEIRNNDTIEVVDSSGKVVFSSGDAQDWPLNLPQNEQYTLSWYEGTQYNEVSLVSDCKYYTYRTDQEGFYHEYPDYVINGEPTKEGYATYDFSDIPAGVYMVDRGGLIEIR